ncbi:DUF951 domain-containing protein [Companilactobacillus sp. DQM5]|uniref:DUF951 domain-containing protein n=1 Tax=Companilactobacillus sp. DQM5 TaxID=3463359 RepID=UPI004058BFDC
MYDLGDIVTMKKPHACGENRWEIIRMGADFKIKCLNCGHIVMMSRKDFEKKIKGIKTKVKDADDTQENYVKF